jgi:hypothetical protein
LQIEHSAHRLSIELEPFAAHLSNVQESGVSTWSQWAIAGGGGEPIPEQLWHDDT